MIKIVGDINLSDGFFDTGFGVGSSIKQGADPFKKLNRCDDDFWIGILNVYALILPIKKALIQSNS